MSLSPRPDRPTKYSAAAVARGPAARARERVRAFERGQDTFRGAAFLERRERFCVARGDVLDAAHELQQRMLGADAGIIEARPIRSASLGSGRARRTGASSTCRAKRRGGRPTASRNARRAPCRGRRPPRRTARRFDPPGNRGTDRSNWSRRRRTQTRHPASRPRQRSARALRGRSRPAARARAADTDAVRLRSRAGSTLRPDRTPNRGSPRRSPRAESDRPT